MKRNSQKKRGSLAVKLWQSYSYNGANVLHGEEETIISFMKYISLSHIFFPADPVKLHLVYMWSQIVWIPVLAESLLLFISFFDKTKRITIVPTSCVVTTSKYVNTSCKAHNNHSKHQVLLLVVVALLGAFKNLNLKGGIFFS